MQKARAFFTTNAPVRRVALDIEAIAKQGQPFKLKAVDENGLQCRIYKRFYR